MDKWNLKEVLIENLKIVEKKSGLNLSNEIRDIQEVDSQLLGMLTRISDKIMVRPNELLDPTFRFSYGNPPPACS